jgi:hypothetical protein
VEAPWPLKFVIVDCKSIINLSQLLQPLKHIEPLEPCLLPAGCGGDKKKICDLLLPLRGDSLFGVPTQFEYRIGLDADNLRFVCI